ncbi:hypothetical protein GCM10009772_15740 [Pseudonocardia alni subsp. carboxydivorans]|uniref:Uncharacterized protein n=1 Tax=Pseudonocardia alni subsp. carboxydivorans TaxID=415010 RepID=A0ABU9AMU3_PSEA5
MTNNDPHPPKTPMTREQHESVRSALEDLHSRKSELMSEYQSYRPASSEDWTRHVDDYRQDMTALLRESYSLHGQLQADRELRTIRSVPLDGQTVEVEIDENPIATSMLAEGDWVLDSQGNLHEGIESLPPDEQLVNRVADVNVRGSVGTFYNEPLARVQSELDDRWQAAQQERLAPYQAEEYGQDTYDELDLEDGLDLD